jgi:importin subunit alpha-1
MPTGTLADDAGRSRRHETTVRIRKLGRDIRVAAQRDIKSTAPALPDSLDDIDKLRRFGLPRLLQDCSRGGEEDKLRAAITLRKLLQSSFEHAPTIASLRGVRAVEQMADVLRLAESTRLQFETVWALSMATWRLADAVADSGAVPVLARLLDSPSAGVREQCCWTLGNLVGAGAAAGD